MSHLNDEEIVKALSLEEAALNEFKMRKNMSSSDKATISSTSSSSSATSYSTRSARELDLISFNAEEAEFDMTMKQSLSNKNLGESSNYEKLKEKILQLNDSSSKHQLIPYAMNQQSPRPLLSQNIYNPYYSQQLYFTPPIQHRIGFENLIYDHQQQQHQYQQQQHFQSQQYYQVYQLPQQQQQQVALSSSSCTSSSPMMIQRYPALMPQSSNNINNNNQVIVPKSNVPNQNPNSMINYSNNVKRKSIESSPSQQSNEQPATTVKPTKDDLINLDEADESVFLSNILHTFDPLMKKHSNNEEAQYSYYADQDPFDYIYSGGTQYSDPLYEAVYRNDKPIVNQKSYYQTYSEPPDDNYTPPLPPRNSTTTTSSKVENTQVPSTSTSAPTSEFYSTHYSKKLYENIVEDKKFDKDALAFYGMVKELRSKYVYSDNETNVGHIKAAQLENKNIHITSIKLIVYPSYECFGNLNDCIERGAARIINQNQSIENYQKLEKYLPPIVFTCDVNSTVIHIIMQALTMLENIFERSPLPEDFVLKTIGAQEWLSDATVSLSQLQYVHDSISMEKDIQLGLFPKSDSHLKAIARSVVDDHRDSDLKIENILPKDSVTSLISYDSVIILLETLEMEMDKIESSSSIMINSFSSPINASGVIQACRAICSLLGCIDTFDLYDAINRLKETCNDQQQQSYANHSKPAIDILSEKGNYAKVSIRSRNVSEEIKYRCDEIRDAVLNLLDIYTQAFQVNYSIKRPQWNSAFSKSTEISQNVMIHLMAIHRPSQTWKFDEYLMGIQIFHGTRFIGEPIITKCSNSLNGFFPRLTFNLWLTFDDVTVSSLPRESRLVFVLYGCMRQIDGQQTSEDNATGGGNSNNMSNNTSNASGNNQELTKVELGWTSLQFFEFDRQMVQGQYFLTIWPPSADKYLVPAPKSGTHPHADYCPILSIEIPSYGNQLVFPQISPNENIPKLDFLSLDNNLQEELLDTIDQGIFYNQIDKREVLWEKRYYLHQIPKALPKLLNAAHCWDYSALVELHGLIQIWSPLKPLTSLELLLPRFPDSYVRGQAVKWISKMTDEELIDYLPQLIQALKFDCYDSSPLSCFLLGRALQSPPVAHYLYWLLTQNLPGDCPQNNMETNQYIEDDYVLLQYRFHRRNQLLLRALLAICGEKLCKQFLSQNVLCKWLDDVAKNVKVAKDSLKLSVLRQNIENVHQILHENPTSLPLSPGKHVHGISSRTCFYFNSNTLPLKINFLGPDGLIIPAIYKCGDDLQQDMLTLQIVRIIDKMWLKEGLDLKMVTFQCVSTGRNRGMIEMITNAETLRKIQVEFGLTGSFKDKPIAEWLQKMNENPLDYQRAVENFTASCAGYSIITFLLGIGDRHNDNVLIQTSGHIFHIDFGKFLGDAQMFGNFRRDRVPFILTSDMAYVINGGDRPSEKFHNFVDLCCKAFNIVRKNGDLLLHIFALMASSGIPGASEAVNYVRGALMVGLSNSEAASNFAKMIHVSLKSWFTQFNFFLHNLAQMRFGNTCEGGELLSFIPKTYNVSQDGHIKDVIVYGYQKRYDLEKRYCYILEVLRQHNPDKVYLFRTFKELCEFHQKLCLLFPLARLHSLQSGVLVGRSNIKTVAERRLPEVRKFIYDLMHSSREIINSDLVVTFFHPLLRDQQEADIRSTKMREGSLTTNNNNSNICGEIKFSIQYHRDTFIVMIHHARSLPLTTSGQEPNTYVKTYLIPDRSKITKRKTRVVKKNCYPSFMETLEYRMPMAVIRLKTLQVTVWSHDSLQENEFLGGVQIPLADLNLKEEIVSWHQLIYLSRSY